MISTGNDIVSLEDIDITRTKNPKFYLKFLSEEERSIYDQPGFKAIPFESFVWLLWSIKEAAFKYLQRLTPALVFTPIKFEVTQLKISSTGNVNPLIDTEGFVTKENHTITGMVNYSGTVLCSVSLINKTFAHSVVNSSADFSEISCGVKQITDPDPQQQSDAVRTFLESGLKKIFRAQTTSIIKSPESIPTAFLGPNQLPVAVSLSHHGRLIAYSLNKTVIEL